MDPFLLDEGGDHRDNPSLNGALESGRRTAGAVLEDLQQG